MTRKGQKSCDKTGDNLGYCEDKVWFILESATFTDSCQTFELSMWMAPSAVITKIVDLAVTSNLTHDLENVISSPNNLISPSSDFVATLTLPFRFSKRNHSSIHSSIFTRDSRNCYSAS